MVLRRLGWILILVLILGASYAAIPWAARQIVQIWLTDQGFQNPRFSISHPTWNELQITEISLSQEDADKRIALDAGPIILRYHPAQLILQQRLKEIQIPNANLALNYKPAINPDPAQAGELALLPLLPTTLIGKVPADRLLVGELNLRLSTPGRPDWKLRGAMDLTDYELNSRVHLNFNNADLGWSDLRFDHRQQFSVKMLYEDQRFINIEGDVEPGGQLQLYFSQQTDLARLRKWLSSIFPDVKQWPRFSGQIRSQGSITLPWSLALEDQHWLRQLTLAQTLETDIAVKQPAPEIRQLVINSDQQLTLKNGELSLEVAPDSKIKLIANASYLPVKSLDLHFKKPFQLKTPLETPDHTQVGGLELSIAAPPVRQQKRTFSGSPLVLKLKPFTTSDSVLSGQLSIKRLNIAEKGQRWPTLALASQFQIDPTQLETQFEVNALQTPLRLKGTASWYSERELADINWQLKPIGLKNIEHLINRYYPALPEELKVTAGLLEHRGWGRWQENQLKLTLRQNVRDMRFKWGELEGQQGQWRSELRIQPDGSWKDRGRVRLGLLDAGLPLENLLGYYSLQQGNNGKVTGTLDRGRMDLLGGELNLQPLTFSTNADDLHTTVELDRLQLAQILALEQQPGLVGTGQISGELPLQYRNGQLTVSDGTLNSLAPGGKIQFNPAPEVAAVANSNPGLKMALEALQNFHYRQLEIGVNYKADGTALLSTRIKGKNPDWNNGRPVNLGINIEENLPKLLKTLQITDELTESLKKRYR